MKLARRHPRRLRVGSLAGAVALGFVLAGAWSTSVGAAIITVPCTGVPITDGAALLTAINAHASGDTVALAAGCTYTLDTAGFTPFSDTLTVQGNGATINRSSVNSFGFFQVNSGGNLTVHDVTFSNGQGGDGGAIFTSEADLTVTNSTFIGNNAGDGGAVSAEGGSGTITITGSTFANNVATTNGGAIHNDDTMILINDTFTGNSGPSGGAYYNNGATGPTTMINDTFSGNTTTTVGAGHGAVENAGGTLTITNSIVANSTGANCGSNGIGDSGNNLESGVTCNFAINAVNANPALGALASNGGPTQTMAITATSPAYDKANATVCAASMPSGAGNVDQRGLSRAPAAPQTACDIGAFELQTPTVAVVATPALTG